MTDTNTCIARYEDLLLTVARYGAFWGVSVKETDDPSSALSGGVEYPSLERAKAGAISTALELFGTDIPEEILVWQANDGSLLE